VTYTKANHDNLRANVIERFGYLPPNISTYTYFRFLHSFCYRPFLRSKKGTLGITFSAPDRFPV
jgi:DNA helicase-2/ATP-dependent DNA helicase PcrA